MEDEAARTRESFNVSADEYYARTARFLPLVEPSIQSFIKLIPRNGRILDAGCGPGRDAKRFSELGYNITGVDFAENMVAFARRLVPTAKFSVMDIRRMDFDDGSFDGVWANNSLIFIKKAEFPSVITEMSRILKKGGCMFVRVKEGDGEGMEKDGRYGDLQKYSAYYRRDELVKMFEDEGLTVLLTKSESYPYEYMTHPFIMAYCKK